MGRHKITAVLAAFATAMMGMPLATAADQTPPAARHQVPPRWTGASSSGSARACSGNACYSYVSGQDLMSSDGATMTTVVASPKGTTSGRHSLFEMAVESPDGRQIAEVGWNVDPLLYKGSTAPHLFVFYWRDGAPTCYNTCGFGAAPGATIRPGAVLTPGARVQLGIRRATNGWLIVYNNQLIGSFNDKLWAGGFKRAGFIQAFGEVAAETATPCTQMGNGQWGTAPYSAWMTSYTHYGASASPRLTMAVTAPTMYKAGYVTGNSFHYGGPGRC